MIQANNRGGGFGWAAQACDALEVNGFDDRFLPDLLMNLGAFFAAPARKRRKKPGYPLVSFAQHPVVGQKDTASIPCALTPRVNNPEQHSASHPPRSAFLLSTNIRKIQVKSGLSKQEFVSIREVCG
jgi:hypothetical protein